MKVGDLVWTNHAAKKCLGLIVDRTKVGMTYGRKIYAILLLTEEACEVRRDEVELELVSKCAS